MPRSTGAYYSAPIFDLSGTFGAVQARLNDGNLRDLDVAAAATLAAAPEWWLGRR